jgi:hypothetical protein
MESPFISLKPPFVRIWASPKSLPKLPTKEQKQERVRISQELGDLEGGSKRRSRGGHNNECQAVSYYTNENKKRHAAA